MPVTARTGHPPDMDIIMSEDHSTGGVIVRKLTFETTIGFGENDDPHWNAIRDAITELKNATIGEKPTANRKVYECVYRFAKSELNKAGPAHAVVQATFLQIPLDPDKIPKD